jgi:hypothetical protein
MSEETPRLRLHLRGPFRVEGPAGEVLTPTSAKAQGLLLLLALSPHGERTRVWLQDKLWSDRAPEQGKGSLKQEVYRLRRLLGPVPGVLGADRQRVRLDLGRVLLLEAGPGELAEGLDVRDGEFDEWLVAQRAATTRSRGPPSVGQGNGSDLAAARIARPQAGGRAVFVRTVGDDAWANWTAVLIADVIATGLREMLSGEVVRGEPPGDAVSALIATAECRSLGGGAIGIRIALARGREANQLWSAARMVTQSGAPPIDAPEVQLLAQELSAAIDRAQAPSGGSLDGLGDCSNADPDLLRRIAVEHIFSLEPERLLLADQMLAMAHSMTPRGLFEAWRAQIRVIQDVERLPGDRRRFREEGERFARRAVEAEPGNSTVLAIMANVRYFLSNDRSASLRFAEQGMALNPANPLALWARSSARLYAGQVRRSYGDAVRGRLLMQGSRFKFFWDLQMFTGAMLQGRLDEATTLLEGAVLHRPNFRPPYRYLSALYAHAGREEDAHAVGATLRRLEPDFSFDRLLNDRSYPASLIHRAEALDKERLATLI